MPPGLQDLLTALRLDGFPVGPGELERLAQAFAREPTLDRNGLRDLLACTLVKDPSRRDAFDALFDAWCPEQEPAWLRASAVPPRGAARTEQRAAAPPPEPDRETGEQASKPGSRAREEALAEPRTRPPSAPPLGPRALAVVLLSVAAALLLSLLLPDTTTRTYVPDIPSVPPDQAIPPPPGSADGAPLDPSPIVYTWVPKQVTVEQPLRLPAWALALLGLLAGAGALGLEWAYRRRRPLPEPDPSPAGGPGWLPLAGTGEAGGSLVDAEARRRLVWNLGRFESEETSRRVDLDATVAATARDAGVVAIRHEQAVYPREIWLWEDELCPDPALPALGEELGHSLTRAGLSLRRGGFAEVPHRVCWGQGDCIAPLMVEGHQRTAMVALLTDGEGLATALDSELERQGTIGLLTGLRHWPHLVLVDFSANGRLQALAEAYGLTWLDPAALPGWLGGEAAEMVRALPARLGGDARTWAAACCLGAQPLSHRDALALHAHLGLDCPTWSYRALVADAGNERLVWPPERRREHINWLIASEWLPLDTPPPQEGRLARALDWWQRRYARDDARLRRHETSLTPFRRTPAQRRRALEQALLRLYADPDHAAPELARLAGPGLSNEIRERLADLAARDQRPAVDLTGREAVYLPWNLRDRPPRTQRLLVRLGLGGDRYRAGRATGRRPGRLGLALGVLTVLCLATLSAAVWRLLTPLPVRIQSTDPTLDGPVMEAQALRRADLVANGSFSVILGSPRRLETRRVAPGAELTVDWAWEPIPTEDRIGDLVVWRTGTLPAPIRGCEDGWPDRSIIALAAEHSDPQARRVAIALLDRGSADLVAFLGRDWEQALPDLEGLTEQGPPNRQALLLRLGPPDDRLDTGALKRLSSTAQGSVGAVDIQPQELLTALAEEKGVKPLAALERWGAGVSVAAGQPLLRFGPEIETDPKTGIGFVRVCPGSFTMGAVDDSQDPRVDPQGRDDERPAHRVALSGFWIAETETTNAQYRLVNPKHDLDDDQPVVNVDWNQARAFCRAIGGDLPSEAQWEYAARAGTITPWSFGADAKAIGAYAWFDGNGEGRWEARPVSEKRANPLGLFDMHGNVWEWTLDWYDPYAEGAQSDPEGPADGTYRVLRGGSFYDPPEVLRSAGRVWVEPWGRYFNFGFRCVRVPARQP